MTRIALVSYLNTRPFIDGLEANFSKGELQLELLPPADCARALKEDRCDLALLPVGALTDFEGIHLMKDHCIGADGEVESVFLFSEEPAEKLDKVVLDLHSRSSNGLTRLLMQHFWKNEPEWIVPTGRSFDAISGSTGAVAIGDRAFRIRDQYPYRYDLAAEWKKWTGLPFVFAVWAYRPDRLEEPRRERIREALEAGICSASESARKWGTVYGYSETEALHYLNHCIDYRLDGPKHEALQLYFQRLSRLENIPIIPAS